MLNKTERLEILKKKRNNFEYPEEEFVIDKERAYA